MRLQEDCSQSYDLRNLPSIGPNGGERPGYPETQEVACFAQHLPFYPGNSSRLADVLTTYEFQMDAKVEDLQVEDLQVQVNEIKVQVNEMKVQVDEIKVQGNEMKVQVNEIKVQGDETHKLVQMLHDTITARGGGAGGGGAGGGGAVASVSPRQFVSYPSRGGWLERVVL